jgi:hypothetical protein
MLQQLRMFLNYFVAENDRHVQQQPEGLAAKTGWACVTPLLSRH